VSLLTEVFKKEKLTFSFEVFPAKTPEGHVKLLEMIKGLSVLNPSFISCTYGAGGGSREKTFDIVEYIQTSCGVPGMAHLTCMSHTRQVMQDILDVLHKRGIKNILAMRGDPPKDNPDWQPGPEHFKYSCELVALIRNRFQGACAIGVAGFPEGHLMAKFKDADARYLNEKIKAGADFVVTQLFFNNQDYFDYVKRLRGLGINARVIPGVLPITDYQALVRFCSMCGATISSEVHDIFKPISNDPLKTKEQGIEFAIGQCRSLLDGGAPGIHFYTLNKVHPVDVILKAVR